MSIYSDIQFLGPKEIVINLPESRPDVQACLYLSLILSYMALNYQGGGSIQIPLGHYVKNEDLKRLISQKITDAGWDIMWAASSDCYGRAISEITLLDSKLGTSEEFTCSPS
jgi:hypothetical protein